jgi:lipopolysaccharide/colanic/teichoic acid biosynthesis glycosyltransferase
VDELRVSGFYLLVKRLIDILGALAGLMGFLIVLPWVAVGILVESGRPVFFRQIRLGQGGKVYSVLKLRTMRQDAEADGQAHWAREGDPRTTKVGTLLRRMHLDEFPQFWNVLKGEMSLVGPRPERPELVAELEKQIPFYRARLLVKPGVSGWAQINYGKGLVEDRRKSSNTTCTTSSTAAVDGYLDYPAQHRLRFRFEGVICLGAGDRRRRFHRVLFGPRWLPEGPGASVDSRHRAPG